jgi:hypothetical protein
VGPRAGLDVEARILSSAPVGDRNPIIHLVVSGSQGNICTCLMYICYLLTSSVSQREVRGIRELLEIKKDLNKI